jgi:hypothetical protein
MAASAGDHLGELLCDGVGCSSSQAAGDVAAAAAAIGSVPDRESSESIGESFAQLAVKVHGRSELKEHESPENFREKGCPESCCSGTLAKLAVWECGQCELEGCDLPKSCGKAVAQHAVKECGQSELKDRESPESFREVGNPESCEQCELKESDSPKNHEKAGAQHAVREHGQSELKDRESPGTHTGTDAFDELGVEGAPLQVVKELSGWQPLELGELEAESEHEQEFCGNEPSGGSKVLANLPVAARGGEQLDVEVEAGILQCLEQLRDNVYAAQYAALSMKARRRFLASTRPLLRRLESWALSPEAVAVLAEIQLCIG